MTRTFTPPGTQDAPSLDPEAVASFFDARARRIDEVGPIRAVIYQDKQGDLAERRDRAEVERLLPLLQLDGKQRFLDVGCGTGRWTARVAPHVRHYHGIDFSAGLLAHALDAHAAQPHCRFTRLGADRLARQALGDGDFDRILCAGVAIYLNDDQLRDMFTGMADVAARGCRIMLREPVGLGRRLTLSEHYSDDLEHEYHAIYRTEDELEETLGTTLLPAGFVVRDRGDVYSVADMNNRAETRQRWLLLEREE